MDLLPRHKEAIIPIEKFTKYALHPENSNGKHVAFYRALGYGINNADKLIENIRSNLDKFPADIRPDKGHGTRYCVEMILIGENGKIARVVTAWIDDRATGQIRLTSVYVKSRKGEGDDY